MHVDVPCVGFVGDVDFGQPEIWKHRRAGADLVARRVGATVGENPDFDVDAGRGLDDALERRPDAAALVVREDGE